jgi:hypothetical protein
MISRTRVMANGVITAAICAATLVATTDAPARSGGFVGGHLNIFGFGHARGFCGPGCRAFAHRHFHRSPQAFAGDGGWDGFSAADNGLVPDDAYGVGTGAAPVAPAVKSGSPCHFETQSYVVPSEAGGERQVAIIRCVRAEMASSSRGVAQER